MRKILIADASEPWRELLENTLSREYEVRCCADGNQAMHLSEQFRPDVLVLDLLLAGIDGLTLIKRLREGMDCPRIIVVGRYFSDYITTALDRYQVDALIMKPCTAQCVAEHVADVLSQDMDTFSVCPEPYDYITSLLVRLGAPTSQQGFRFLRRGILMMMDDPSQQLTKSLYPALAAEFGTSAANVEKALRTTVTTAWSRRRDDIWRNYFPTTPTGQIPRPTAGQFLSRLADAAMSVKRNRA